MWKYLDKEKQKEFILSLNLINKDISDNKKLNILYAISNNPEKYYTKKYIKKKNGKVRELLIPNNLLKSIQRNILYNCLNGLSVSKYAKGYVKNTSLVDNAMPHVNEKVILKLDMQDFFTNILFENVYNALSNSIFPPFAKVLITKLCTYEDYLPQGAPTSPCLSNLVMKNFDDYIGLYCEERNINYTRYCDDLTFSGDFDYIKLKNKVQAFIEELGFNINEDKTKIIKQNNRQIVTGVVVNQKLNAPKTYRMRIRQEMYYIKKFGIDNHLKYIKQNKKEYLYSLRGRINYCLIINKEDKFMQDSLQYLNKICLKETIRN